MCIAPRLTRQLLHQRGLLLAAIALGHGVGRGHGGPDARGAKLLGALLPL